LKRGSAKEYVAVSKGARVNLAGQEFRIGSRRGGVEDNRSDWCNLSTRGGKKDGRRKGEYRSHVGRKRLEARDSGAGYYSRVWAGGHWGSGKKRNFAKRLEILQKDDSRVRLLRKEGPGTVKLHRDAGGLGPKFWGGFIRREHVKVKRGVAGSLGLERAAGGLKKKRR